MTRAEKRSFAQQLHESLMDSGDCLRGQLRTPAFDVPFEEAYPLTYVKQKGLAKVQHPGQYAVGGILINPTLMEHPLEKVNEVLRHSITHALAAQLVGDYTHGEGFALISDEVTAANKHKNCTEVQARIPGYKVSCQKCKEVYWREEKVTTPCPRCGGTVRQQLLGRKARP